MWAHWLGQLVANLCFSDRWRDLNIVVSSDAGSRPGSIPTNRPINAGSYKVPSTAGSLIAHKRCRNWMHGNAAQPHRATASFGAQLQTEQLDLHTAATPARARPSPPGTCPDGRLAASLISAIDLPGQGQLICHRLHAVGRRYASTGTQNQRCLRRKGTSGLLAILRL